MVELGKKIREIDYQQNNINCQLMYIYLMPQFSLYYKYTKKTKQVENMSSFGYRGQKREGTQNSSRDTGLFSKNDQNLKTYIQNLSYQTENKNLLKQKLIQDQKSVSDQKYRNDNWTQSDIKKIFILYAQYGSQWKIIQTEFPEKSSNSIKNRFYTVVRTFLKTLFREHPDIQNKLPHEIPSKTILRFYQGRSEFNKFKGFGKKIMKKINYDVDSKLIPKVVQENLDDVYKLFTIVFPSENVRNSSLIVKKVCLKKLLEEKQLKIQIQQQKQSETKKIPKTQTQYQNSIQIHKTKKDEGTNIQPQIWSIPPMYKLYQPFYGLNFCSLEPENPVLANSHNPMSNIFLVSGQLVYANMGQVSPFMQM